VGKLIMGKSSLLSELRAGDKPCVELQDSVLFISSTKIVFRKSTAGDDVRVDNALNYLAIERKLKAPPLSYFTVNDWDQIEWAINVLAYLFDRATYDKGEASGGVGFLEIKGETLCVINQGVFDGFSGVEVICENSTTEGVASEA
jgi:hypothetical protein